MPLRLCARRECSGAYAARVLFLGLQVVFAAASHDGTSAARQLAHGAAAVFGAGTLMLALALLLVCWLIVWPDMARRRSACRGQLRA
ncbi:hypothetical protein ACFPAG_17805 [Vogesella sp. GCM10023246]|uniref:Uncharacterized protein n=1 Tax=Vogesella oryzagri TaxID=3160864 RepID=A0ABV1MA79_9NEIS